jgi:dynein heavy chain
MSDFLNSQFTTLNAEKMDSYIFNCNRTISKVLKLIAHKSAPHSAASQLKKEIDDMKLNMPLITRLRHPGIRTRHWKLILDAVGIKDPPPEDTITLKYILDLHLENHEQMVINVTDFARNEHALEAALDKMYNDLKGYSLKISLYKDTNTYIVHSTEDLFDILEDQLTTLQTMFSSPFIGNFLERAKDWKEKLLVIQRTMEAWLDCQSLWTYFTSVFSSDDVQKELQSEADKYEIVDNSWRDVMHKVHINPRILVVCEKNDLAELFEENRKIMDRCLKQLNSFLEVKRKAFPRLYFLSNREVLDILAVSKDPTSIQPLLRKCFESLDSLIFSVNKDIVGMMSSDGEVIHFTESVTTSSCNVESWLLKVEKTMKKSVRELLRKVVSSHAQETREEWIMENAAQVVLTTNQIIFTHKVTQALTNSNKMEALKHFIAEKLNFLSGMIKQNLTARQRSTIQAMMVLDVHNRDVIEELSRSNTNSLQDFEWQSQLRYYWEENECIVRIIDANFVYGYEYLGNTGRLVVTPLTERCFRTLTNALHLNLGGACIGPSSTGKTETVQELAKVMAKQCVVFNCSAEMNYKSLANFFKGLASAGAYSCFDEFNRIELEVLSVIAQHILTIQHAISEGVKQVKYFHRNKLLTSFYSSNWRESPFLSIQPVLFSLQ